MHVFHTLLTAAFLLPQVLATAQSHNDREIQSPSEDLLPDNELSNWQADVPSASSLMNLTFSRQGAQECGTINNEFSAFILAIHSIPTSPVCFNFSILFEDRNNTYLAPIDGYPADDSECGITYQLHRTIEGQHGTGIRYSYDQFYYQQRSGGADGDEASGRLNLTTYPLFDCTQQQVDVPGYTWTCNSEGRCDGLQEGALNSFSIGPVSEAARRNETCVVAAREGEASVGSTIRSFALLSILACVGSTLIPAVI